MIPRTQVSTNNPGAQATLFFMGDQLGLQPSISLGLAADPSAGMVVMRVDNLGSGASSYGLVQTINPLLSGRWMHVAATFDGAMARIFYEGALRVQGPLPAPTLATRSLVLIGRAGFPGSNFRGLLDNLRVWTAALMDSQIQAGMLGPPVAVLLPSLVLFYACDETSLVDMTMHDSGPRKLNASTPYGLHCSTLACRVPSTVAEKLVCGDGLRASTEACDDGNQASGDGCSAACAVEAGYVCIGGEDLVSTDMCELGTAVMTEGFETATVSQWSPTNGVFGSWSVNPLFKHGGQYGLRIGYAGSEYNGCPEFIGNGVFRFGLAPVSVGTPTAYAAPVNWTSLRLPAAEPGGSSFVLQLGWTGVRSRANISYPVAARPGMRAQEFIAGTYRVSAYVYVECNGCSGSLFDGVTSLMDVRFFDSSAHVLASGSGGFPAYFDVWAYVYFDVVVTATTWSTMTARFGYPMLNTKGRVWMTRLSVVRQCPGIPDGPIVWLRADAGPAQISGTVPVWPDSGGVGTSAYSGVQNGFRSSPPTMVVTGGPDGLPFVRFTNVNDGMQFDDSLVTYSRDIVIFMVARYTPGTTFKGRILQGRGENWICGYWSAQRGESVVAAWVVLSACTAGVLVLWVQQQH